MEIFGVEHAFRYCPPGTFTMGAPESETAEDAPEYEYDETLHKVTLTRGFWLLETPVTQAMWERATGENPSYFAIREEDADEIDEDARNLDASDFPVDSVSWDACQEYIEKLQEFAPSGLRFALPTEAQWEYACRAGTETPFSFGETLNGDQANCDGTQPYGTDEIGDILDETTPVRKYAPNAWGLFDMHGNVWEWCADWYGPYPDGDATDPIGPDDGDERVSRGGGYYYGAGDCRSAARNYCDPTLADPGQGARVALVQR